MNDRAKEMQDWIRATLRSREAYAEQRLSAMRVALNDRENIGKLMHESWSAMKRAQGFHGPTDACLACMPPFGGIARRKDWIRCSMFHADLVPWEQLPEAQKDINRHAFDAVIRSLSPEIATKEK